MAKFIVMCGLPGSGKTTNAFSIRESIDAFYVSSDDTRKTLFGSENNQEHNNEVFETMNKLTVSALSHGRDVIYDASNISYKRRMALIQRFKKYNPQFCCVICYTPYEKCIEYNDLREKKVPHEAIRKMLMNFYFPQKFEGWDEIAVIYPEDMKPNKTLNELLSELREIPHDNLHHSLSIGDHIIATYNNCFKVDSTQKNLLMAALLHDIGKPFCKTFEDTKGNKTENAHYYQHHLVSGYFAFPYLIEFSVDDMLNILAMIDFHMHPFFWEKENNEKIRKKYMRLWGNQLYGEIMELHKCDKEAH